jgi:hypothetical protein
MSKIIKINECIPFCPFAQEGHQLDFNYSNTYGCLVLCRKTALYYVQRMPPDCRANNAVLRDNIFQYCFLTPKIDE